jgi:hypothetical protein
MFLDELKIIGEVCVSVFGPDGNLKEKREIHNLVVQGGKNFIAAKLLETEATKIQYVGMGLGSTAPTLADVQLQSEVATRAVIESASRTDNLVTFNGYFLPNNPNYTVNVTEVGLFNASSGGIMIARTTFPAVQKEALDVLAVQWKIRIG